MLTSKQRAYLRGIANSIDTILMVGKGSITDQVVKQAEDALYAREIIKGKFLKIVKSIQDKLLIFYQKNLL